MSSCPYCDGACAGVDLTPLLVDARRWLWTQLAVIADKRGDPHLASGRTSIVASHSAEERAAVVGLIGTLAPGVRRRIALDELARKLQARASSLTPGAVAAHAVQRRLAMRAAQAAERADDELRLARLFVSRFAELEQGLRSNPTALWNALRRAGWASKLIALDDAELFISGAAAVIAALPTDPDRIDRRRLAAEALGDPHALDEGTATAGFTLAVLAAAGRTNARARPRLAWRSVGVECDDITSGLIALGIAPEGWSQPPGTVLTLSPRVLASCTWPSPSKDGDWIFVTENPSIVTAAADHAASPIHLLCTSGTPSMGEIAAIDRLASAGWRVAVRADFDEAGLAHVNALLRGVRNAITWRMSSSDYRASMRDDELAARLDSARLPSTPWDHTLATAMVNSGRAAFEEALLPALLDDLVAGQPAQMPAAHVTEDWVSVEATRNFLFDDPLLDWLERHGANAGFVRDNERPGYDPRTDFPRFLREKTRAFKAAVGHLLVTRATVVRIDASTQHEAVHATIDAMRAGAAVIARAAVEDTLRGLRGSVDFLVRSDLLSSWFPELLTGNEARISAPRIAAHDFHYRPVLAKYRALELGETGDAIGARATVEQARMRMLALALGSMQGLTPSAGYLLGRTYSQRKANFDGCLDRLARVDVTRSARRLDRAAENAMLWLRSLEREGAAWHVLPAPSRPELFPNMRNDADYPWHTAKLELAEAIGELTLLPGVTTELRRRAHAAGILRISDSNTDAALLGVKRVHVEQMDAVIAANRRGPGAVVPARFVRGREFLDAPAPLELFVDVESVSNADDDFSAMPRANGRAQIVVVGCGGNVDGQWIFRQWIVDAITRDEEIRVLDEWLAWVTGLAAERGLSLASVPICHWSAAEPVTIERAYATARDRSPECELPSLSWFDVYREIFIANRVAVAGAFDLRLKSMSRLLQTVAPSAEPSSASIADGAQAMVAMWRASRESAGSETRLAAHPLVRSVAGYNERDVRLLADVVAWVRRNR